MKSVAVGKTPRQTLLEPKTYYQPYVIRSAANEKVVLICTQPTSLSLSTKVLIFKDALATGMLVLHYCSPRSYHHLLPVFQTFWTWVKGMTMQNIVAGFHTTGVYPFNRSALSQKRLHLLKSLTCVSFLSNQAYLQQQ